MSAFLRASRPSSYTLTGLHQISSIPGHAKPPRLENVPQGAAEFVVGWFNETLAPFLAGHSENVSFLHVDCDLYSSTRSVLDALNAPPSPRLHAGAVIVFDELFNYPEFAGHELRALWDLYACRVSNTGVTCPLSSLIPRSCVVWAV